MAESIHNYEQVSIYPLDADVQEKLLTINRECVFNWCTRDNWPMGVIMSYIWMDGRAWLTAGAHRHRISAVRRNPQVSVVVTSTGTALGPGKTVTIKGRCIVHEDRETKDKFYGPFSRHLNPDSEERAKFFQEFLDSPLRVVLEVIPEKFVTYDGAKMGAHTAGTLSDDQLGAPKEVDTVRLQNELRRRGMLSDA